MWGENVEGGWFDGGIFGRKFEKITAPKGKKTEREFPGRGQRWPKV